MSPSSLAAEFIDLAGNSKRFLAAIAGPPGSGKSTLAERVNAKINHYAKRPLSTIVPMDGFHLDNVTLDKLGLRQRKGAPETFDANAFIQLISVLRASDDPVSVPLFDRSLDAVIHDAKIVSPQHQIILVEGNYLLLAQEPWRQLADLFDFSVFLNPEIEILEHRLVDRWISHGHDPVAAKQRALSNDIPNAKFVLAHSMPAELVI